MKRKTRLLCRMLLVLCFIMQAAAHAAFAAETAGEGFVPRLSDYQIRFAPDGAMPLAASLAAEYTAGANFAVKQNMLAFSDLSADSPLLRVCELRGGELLPIAEYPESASIISIVWGAQGLSYLVGERWEEGETELVIARPDGGQSRFPLGTASWGFAQELCPLASLNDGRLLFVNGNGILRACEADGSGMRQVTDAQVHSFVYCDPYVYFTRNDDMVTYRDVYCHEYGEYLDVSYPRLYRVRLDGTDMEQMTAGGVRGLSAWGPYVLYQDIDDPFVWPQGEMPEEWLYGVVACIDGATGRQASLAVDSACYYPTASGLAAWVPEFANSGAGHEGDAAGFSLILYGWDGKPLCRLDHGSLCWDEANCISAGDTIWALSYGYIDLRDCITLSAIPLDGGIMETVATYP